MEDHYRDLVTENPEKNKTAKSEAWDEAFSLVLN